MTERTADLTFAGLEEPMTLIDAFDRCPRLQRYIVVTSTAWHEEIRSGTLAWQSLVMHLLSIQRTLVLVAEVSRNRDPHNARFFVASYDHTRI
jgi:hypothetical protein